MAHPIEDHALIGDMESAALVTRDGTVDWLCWPRFDSDACFAALLGTADHGYWRIAPTDPAVRTSRRYRGDTMILDTVHHAGSGTVQVTDFMPLREGRGPALVRLVTGLSGTVEMRHDLALRFDYGSIKPWLVTQPGGFVGIVGPDLVILRCDVELAVQRGNVSGVFTVAAGRTIAFVLQYGASHLPAPPPVDVSAALAATERFWSGWAARFDKPTDWPDAVRRSLITLKALIHGPTGGLVAAPTLGLPEKPGGAANWDYRYCWLRDSTFALCALLNAGYVAEATAWRDWLLRAVADAPNRLQIMYGVDGGRHIGERKIPWLPGFEGAQPVRVGNAAAEQHQLDVPGELLDALHLTQQAGIERRPWGIEIERAVVEHVEKIWRQPDHGIWESRDAPQEYTYSKVMAWVAVDRFLKGSRSGEGIGRDRLRRLTTLRRDIHADVCHAGFSAARNSFVQRYGATELDASLLLLPLVGFLPATEPRMRGTIAAIERELVEDGLVRRQASRNSADEEGAFLPCSLWLADCLGMQGRGEDARRYLERVLGLRNDVGLLSEEWHVPSRRMLGNFPQSLTHLALVNTAIGLCGPVYQRGG